MTKYSPWSNPADPEVFFKLEAYNQLLKELGWEDKVEWLSQWMDRGGRELAVNSWQPGTKSDWFWGLGLPFLSDVERYLFNKEERKIFGISGLPGSGKTSFGKWLNNAALELDWPLTVISIDDFYLPAPELEKAMAGNPWEVPRGLPGSHSIQLINKTLEKWEETGHLKAPQFDKALRNGRGDRSGWVHSNPKILVIEGWFIGCPLSADMQNSRKDHFENEPLRTIEKDFRVKVQHSLSTYQTIWNKFERIWHLKAEDFQSVNSWKTQQETNQQRERGASLKGDHLQRFLRMIQTAIPQEDLQSVKSNVVATLDTSRRITWVGPRESIKGLARED